MQRRTYLRSLAGGAAVVLGGCSSDSDGPTPVAEAEVVVGPDGEFRFDPTTVFLERGGTVTWRWDSGGHNVKPVEVPEDADWSGTPGGEFDTFESGHEYSHTFEVTGRYDYVCRPHIEQQMRGGLQVE